MKVEKLANKLLYTRYKQRLLEAISEVDVLDKDGRIIISKDLKVRHKDSGYEYTVDDVVDDSGDISVILRDPSAPRVEPQGEETLLGAPPAVENELSEEDLVSSELESEEDLIFVVDQKEFEEEYEVK